MTQNSRAKTNALAQKRISNTNFFNQVKLIFAKFPNESAGIDASVLRAELHASLGATPSQISGYLNKAHTEYNQLTFDRNNHRYRLNSGKKDFVKAAYNSELRALTQVLNQSAAEMTIEQLKTLKNEQQRLEQLI